MHRLLALVAAAALMLGLAAPAALAAEPTSRQPQRRGVRSPTT